MSISDSDSTHDANWDSDTDADTDSDSNTDSVVDKDTDADTGTDTNTVVNTGTDTELYTGTDTVADSGADTGVDNGTDTDVDTGTDMSADTGTDTGADNGTDTGADNGTDTGADNGTDTDVDTGTDTETDTGTDTAVSDTETESAVIASATLVHRWSFNNSLVDSVGQSDAEIVVPSGASGTDYNLTADAIILGVSNSSAASYVSLGTHLLTKVGGAVSVEVFGTYLRTAYYSRIFEFGNSANEYLIMTWLTETNVYTDLVRWKDASQVQVTNSNAPYTIGQEYHIIMVVEPDAGASGNLQIRWYTAPSSATNLGGAKGSFETSDALENLNDSNCWLGKSISDADPISPAEYNEVRIWSGAITPTDAEILHDLGPENM
ncbi:MAG: hypothetical protein JXR76_06110 [Deltaproteobacteria bacterium]|nr:hypothetical protein [Deltaproteobacteria bacterium]